MSKQQRITYVETPSGRGGPSLIQMSYPVVMVKADMPIKHEFKRYREQERRTSPKGQGFKPMVRRHRTGL